ncbi:MAG: DUF1122 family protein [Dehalococcoidia bacterium]
MEVDARFQGWTPVSEEPDHPLTPLGGAELTGGRLRVLLGRRSRFGARYFALLLELDGRTSLDPVLSGLHNSGPLPSYNWVEVAETNVRIRMADGSAHDVGAEGVERLFVLLYELLPPGGHLMVEYDSAQRAETAEGLAHQVPPIATPLGAALYGAGFGAHFKDWQIAEGGSEGPRKLQAYKPPSEADAARWRNAAFRALEAFLARPEARSETSQAARERAEALLSELRGSA